MGSTDGGNVAPQGILPWPIFECCIEGGREAHLQTIDGAIVWSPNSTEETMNIRNLILAAAIAIATASSPALAASHRQNRAGFNAYGAAQDATEAMSPDRAQALRDCNDTTLKMRDYTWGVQIGQS
jgi:hypothetical protein